MSKLVLHITDSNFEAKVLKSKKIVLLDFWASWCEPCMSMMPLLEKLAKDVGDGAIIASINVDENPDVTEKFDITSIPTFMVFENGEMQKSVFGSMEKDKLFETFHKWLF